MQVTQEQAVELTKAVAELNEKFNTLLGTDNTIVVVYDTGDETVGIVTSQPSYVKVFTSLTHARNGITEHAAAEIEATERAANGEVAN